MLPLSSMPRKIIQITSPAANMYHYTLFALDDQGQVWGLRGTGAVYPYFMPSGWEWDRIPQHDSTVGFVKNAKL